MKVFQLIATAMIATAGLLASADTLTVLTDRKPETLQSAFADFTQKTGVNVQVVAGSYADLKARINAGETADLLMLKDVGAITAAARAGLYEAMNAANRRTNVAPYMRDPNGLWTAFAYRVRTFVYDPTVIDARSLTTLEALAGPQFEGQLCIRNAKDYMPALVAWMVARYGEAKTEAILRGWKNNLAAGFTANDTESLKNISGGSCTAGISNHYYLARQKSADSRFPVELAFAEQREGGVPTNGFGGGVVKGTRQSANANKLIGYMLTADGQNLLIANPSFEYPAVQSMRPVSLVQSFGTFKASELSWNEVGAKVDTANEILERVGWAK